MQTHSYTGKLALTALWQAKPGEEEAVAKILDQLVPQARREPGVQAFIVHRVEEDPTQFLLYEMFDDADAFAAHQETEHFRTLVVEQALPRLAKRERTRCLPA
jgi:quinol monooxygenase YgiN